MPIRHSHPAAKITIRHVAQKAGVSVATVSHVLNDTHYVSTELTDRVLSAIRELDYRPNKLARALSRKVIPLIALIVPDISNPYWSFVARAIQDVTDKQDYSVIVCSSDGLQEREERFLRSLMGLVSGIILHPYHIEAEQINQLVGGMPVVINGDYGGMEIPASWDQVMSDNLECGAEATRHLIGLGHRKIAHISGTEGTPSSRKRLQGYRKALEEAGIPPDEQYQVEGKYTLNGGRQAMQRLLDLPKPPTAVFCANDLSALGALETAQSRQLRVPEDLSIVGFDDIEDASLSTPPLTTIHMSQRDIGRTMAETLLERLDGRTEPVTKVIHGVLAVRGSTAPPQSQ